MSFDEGDTLEEVIEDPTAPGEYGIAQVALNHEIDEEERDRLREEYGRIRTFFKTRPERFQNVQRWLNQARFGVTYDQYLTTSVWYSLAATAVGAVFGVLLTAWLASLGLIGDLHSPFTIRADWVLLVANNKLLFATVGFTVLSGLTLGVGLWATRYYYPLTVVSTRRQSIDIQLPHAIVFMYALSYGGMGLPEVMRRLAQSDETYGEVAREFEMILNDLDLFGSDVYTAIQSARNLTPSDNFEQFLDDLLSVVDSGGDVTTFLEQQSETYLREAQESQEDFLETLAILAEVFVVGFVAAPLFMVVTLVVISLLGGATLPAISSLIYLVMPVGSVAFLWLIHIISQPFGQGETDPDVGFEMYDTNVDPPVDDERFEAYRADRRRQDVRAFLRDPWVTVRREPLYSLAVTVPAALLVAGAVVATGLASPTLAAMREAPVVGTTLLFVVPLVVATLPLTYLYERRRRRRMDVARRFPDTMNILSSANKMGIRLTDALDLVSRWSSGALADELRRVRNDLAWNHDPTAALLGLGDRLRVPQLTRSMKLLAEGMQSSSDLSRVLSIAAEDTRNREKMERRRRRELTAYIAVVVIGFLVFLLIVAILDGTYLAPLEKFSTTQSGGAEDLPVTLIDIPVQTYRLLFFHSALLQALGSGLIAGKLADNEVLSGLKYALALVGISVVAFLFI